MWNTEKQRDRGRINARMGDRWNKIDRGRNKEEGNK
jgi:hypothetical protein